MSTVFFKFTSEDGVITHSVECNSHKASYIVHDLFDFVLLPCNVYIYIFIYIYIVIKLQIHNADMMTESL